MIKYQKHIFNITLATLLVTILSALIFPPDTEAMKNGGATAGSFNIGSALFTFLGFLIIPGGLYLALKQYKQEHSGFISIGQGTGLSFKIAAIAGVIVAVVVYIFYKYINHETIEAIQNVARDKMQEKFAENGGEGEEMAMKWLSTFSGPGMLAIGQLIYVTLYGVIAGLIISAIIKNEPPANFDPFANQQSSSFNVNSGNTAQNADNQK
ncbi:MAG: DUF4199 domain-containing protein [Bacteroidota bacterium]|nr:DUF4199 domain-containing protein [Bacteroidota bacterium]